MSIVQNSCIRSIFLRRPTNGPPSSNGTFSCSGIFLLLRLDVLRVHRLVVDSVVGALEALVVKIPQVSDEAATLGEFAIAEDAAEFSPDSALESDVADEIALCDVRPRATGALPLAARVADFAADRPAMAVQGEDVGVPLPAA